MICIDVLDNDTFIVLFVSTSRSTIQNEQLVVIVPVFGYHSTNIVLLFDDGIFKLDYTSLKHRILVFLECQFSLEVIEIIQDCLNFILQKSPCLIEGGE